MNSAVIAAAATTAPSIHHHVPADDLLRPRRGRREHGGGRDGGNDRGNDGGPTNLHARCAPKCADHRMSTAKLTRASSNCAVLAPISMNQCPRSGRSTVAW